MDNIITLPKPNYEGSILLEHALAARRSRRNFLKRTLTPQEISQLVWAAQGQDANHGYRTAPSAGATYPLELLVVSAEGLFRYLPEEHALEKLAGNDLRSKLAAAAWEQSFVGDASLTLVFAAQFSRTTKRYGRRGLRYVYMEVGHAAQNVHLQAEALGLGSVAVGAFDDESVSKVLSLEKHLEPLYMVAVGHCRH